MRIFLYAPLSHSEDYADQQLSVGLYESLRRDTEAFYGVRDPTRKGDRAMAGDVGALSRLIKGGPPPCGGKDVHTQIYWMSMVARAHGPIIRVYGRFVERDAVLDRQEAEKANEEGLINAGKQQRYSACG